MQLEEFKKLCDELDIIVSPFNSANGGLKGVAMAGEGSRLIGYNAALDENDLSFVMAHEIAHHVIGHLGEGKIKPNKDGLKIAGAKAEKEANIFAAVFMAIDMYQKAVTV